MKAERCQERDELERQIAALTEWRTQGAAATNVWRSALQASQRAARGRPTPWRRVMSISTPMLVAACVTLLIGGAFVVAILDSVGSRSREHARTSVPAVSQPASGEVSGRAMSAVPASNDFDSEGIGGGGLTGGYFESHDVGMLNLSRMTPRSSVGSSGNESLPSRSNQSTEQQGSSPARHVVRKANITIETDDVRAVFARAALLVSEVQSEYVQDSSLTGSGADAQAQLTLRVAADRLPTLLNQLRELGKVLSESSAGEDVTAQIVDLDARLRNELRIEQELLELLEKRSDAPLKEILDLRDRIGQVRLSIESLHAQQQRISRLVSLATILVIIRPPPQLNEKAKPAERSIGTYFSESISTSWTAALHRLADSVGTTLSIIVGGLVWWAIAIAAILAVRAIVRRRLIAPAPAAI